VALSVDQRRERQRDPQAADARAHGSRVPRARSRSTIAIADQTTAVVTAEQ